MPAQAPMAERMQEVLESLWNHGTRRADSVECQVLKRLIKQGKVRRTLAPYGWGGKTCTMIEAIEVPPKKEELVTGGPFAKRRAAMEESGLNYRGKNWGKVRVDLPREEREKAATEKKQMWSKLKGWQVPR